jgi:hypothetical protein
VVVVASTIELATRGSGGYVRGRSGNNGGGEAEDSDGGGILHLEECLSAEDYFRRTVLLIEGANLRINNGNGEKSLRK